MEIHWHLPVLEVAQNRSHFASASDGSQGLRRGVHGDAGEAELFAAVDQHLDAGVDIPRGDRRTAQASWL